MAKPNFDAQQAEDGTWMVVDAATARPVVIDGYPQIGMTVEDATDLAKALSKVQGDANDAEPEGGLTSGQGTAGTELTAPKSDHMRLKNDGLE